MSVKRIQKAVNRPITDKNESDELGRIKHLISIRQQLHFVNRVESSLTKMDMDDYRKLLEQLPPAQDKTYNINLVLLPHMHILCILDLTPVTYIILLLETYRAQDCRNSPPKFPTRAAWKPQTPRPTTKSRKKILTHR